MTLKIIKNKTKGVIVTVFPIVFSVFIMMSGFSVMMFSGCLNAEIKPEIKAKADIKVKTEVKAEAKVIDATDNSKKEAKMDIENSGSTIEKQNQTSNIGAFSGGAPYLMAIILAMLLYHFKITRGRIASEKENNRLEKEEREFIIEALKDALKEHGNTDAQICKKIEQNTKLIKKS